MLKATQPIESRSLMKIQRKRFLFPILILIVGLLGFFIAPRDTAQGIELGGTLYAGQSVFDNLQYRLLMKHTLHGDTGALESLVKFDCGGGAGCYDHGEVLVQLLRQIGDAKFSTMAKKLRKETKDELCSLLAAGFEYGSTIQPAEREVRFPMTTKVLAAFQPASR
jgi:hypothetical protein